MRWIPLAILCLAVPLSQAAAHDRPEGSYRKTCRNELVIGPILEAQCERKDGQMATTMINYWNCDSDIVNHDGVLKCKDRKRRHLPGGSYKHSCHDIRMHHGRLEAECQKKDGEWRSTSIKVDKCYGSIENDNGKLRCE